MVTCLIGFMGILGFMGTITLSNRPWYFSLFPPSQVRLDVRLSAWYSSLFTSPSLTGGDGVGLFYCPKKTFTIALASAIVMSLSPFTLAFFLLKFLMLDLSVERK